MLLCVGHKQFYTFFLRVSRYVLDVKIILFGCFESELFPSSSMVAHYMLDTPELP